MYNTTGKRSHKTIQGRLPGPGERKEAESAERVLALPTPSYTRLLKRLDEPSSQVPSSIPDRIGGTPHFRGDP